MLICLTKMWRSGENLYKESDRGGDGTKKQDKCNEMKCNMTFYYYLFFPFFSLHQKKSHLILTETARPMTFLAFVFWAILNATSDPLAPHLQLLLLLLLLLLFYMKLNLLLLLLLFPLYNLMCMCHAYKMLVLDFFVLLLTVSGSRHHMGLNGFFLFIFRWVMLSYMHVPYIPLT